MFPSWNISQVTAVDSGDPVLDQIINALEGTETTNLDTLIQSLSSSSLSHLSTIIDALESFENEQLDALIAGLRNEELSQLLESLVESDDLEQETQDTLDNATQDDQVDKTELADLLSQLF